jgi:hypothetical protein
MWRRRLIRKTRKIKGVIAKRSHRADIAWCPFTASAIDLLAKQPSTSDNQRRKVRSRSRAKLRTVPTIHSPLPVIGRARSSDSAKQSPVYRNGALQLTAIRVSMSRLPSSRLDNSHRATSFRQKQNPAEGLAGFCLIAFASTRRAGLPSNARSPAGVPGQHAGEMDARQRVHFAGRFGLGSRAVVDCLLLTSFQHVTSAPPFTVAGLFLSAYEMRAVVEDWWPERVQALRRFQWG